MKENLKKIGKYLLILLLLITGLGAIALLFLFFVPSASLFGISYVSGDKLYYSKAYDVSDFLITEVKLVNNSYNVRLINSADNNISVKVFDNTFGFVYKTNKNLNLSSKINKNSQGNQLEITVDEPHGLSYKSDSYIELRVPKKITDLGINLVNKSADVSVNLDKSTVLNTLSISSASGSINLTAGKIAKNLNLDISRSSMSISKDFDFSGVDLALSLTSGKFDSLNNEQAINNVTINKLGSGRINLNNCNEVNANLKDAGGKITIKNLNGTAIINSTDTNVVIENVSQDGGQINLTKSGSITLNKVLGIFNATTSSGDISIDKTYAPMILKSKSGNITVKSAEIFKLDAQEAPIQIINTDGNINLSYSAMPLTNCWAEIINHNGKTVVNDIKRLDLTITGSGRAEIYYDKVVGISNLNATGKGNILVKTPSNIDLPEESLNKYTLITASDNGTVSIALTQTTDLDSSLGDTNKNEHPTYVGTKEDNPAGKEWKDNVINIHTNSGSITVRNR